jgi:hypothetical protein
VLADELHARTGWPVVALGDGADGVVGWVHAGVVTPAGLVLDVEGLHEPQDWAERWGAAADAYGEDHEDYDSDAVWAHDARQYGWAGPGTPFSKAEAREAVGGHAAKVADVLLGHAAVQHLLMQPAA